MLLTKRWAWLLVAAGAWSWLIWPTFLHNIWADPRSWHHGMTGFFAVHLALSVISLALGTLLGFGGIRGLRGARPVANATDTRHANPA